MIFVAKVTIVVPIYNVEKYLKDCFESFLKQTSHDFVVLAINDGSPDNSQVIIDEYVQKFPEIFHCIKKENGGYGSVLQLAVNTIETPYFLICDPDDTLEPDAVRVLLDLAEVSDADITIGAKSYVYVNSTDKDYTYAYNREFVTLLTNTVYHRGTAAYNDLFFIDPSPHAKLYKREVARNISFPEKVGYTDNILFYLSLLTADKVIYTDISLANYLIDRPGNTMTDVSFKALNGQISVFKGVINQAERRTNIPPIFWYRMFESFKYMLYQTRNLSCSEEEFMKIMDHLETFLDRLKPYDKDIRPFYKKYSKNGFVEKTRDSILMGKIGSKAVYQNLKKKMLKEFRENQAKRNA